MVEFAEQEVEEYFGGYYYSFYNGGEEDQGKGNVNYGIQEIEVFFCF